MTRNIYLEWYWRIVFKKTQIFKFEQKLKVMYSLLAYCLYSSHRLKSKFNRCKIQFSVFAKVYDWGIPRKVVVLFLRLTLDHSSAFRRQWFSHRFSHLIWTSPRLWGTPSFIPISSWATIWGNSSQITFECISCTLWDAKWKRFHWLRLPLPFSPKTFMVTRRWISFCE